MPRFTEDEMRDAVLKVAEEGLSVNRVAKDYGLCKKTLKSYVDKYQNNFGYNGSEISFRPNYEINQVFTRKLEQIFEDHLLSLDFTQHKITRDFMREEAYNFATMCNVHVPKTWNVRKRAGQDWMYSFLNRHPKVKSVIVRNKKNVEAPFQIVNQKVLDEENIIPIVGTHMKNDECELKEVNMVQKNHRVNEHENGDSDTSSCYFSRIHVKSPLDEFLENITLAYGMVAEKNFINAEQVYNLGEIALVVDDSLSRNGEELLMTACCFFNAAGNYLPPFFVLPRKGLSTLEVLPEGAAGIARSTGRLDSSAFSLVLEHFQRHIEAISAKKVVLIMDVDEHHITINSLDFCQEHGIEVVTLPPQYGSNLQPAERYIFPTIRSLFNQCLHKFHTCERTYLTAERIALLFCRIQKIAFSTDHICKGFSENGIFPLNDLFIADEFLSQRLNHYEPRVDLTDISLVFPESLSVETVFLDEEKSPVQHSPPNVPFETLVEEFYNNLVQAYSELEAHGGVRPEKIYNVDEFEISISFPETNHSNSCVSVCCYANALGHSLPPFVVYPEAEYSPAMLVGGIDGTRGTTSTDGHIDNSIFLQMLQHFQQFVDANLSDRVVLLMDCENEHISLKTIDFCESNGIILVTVPPQTTELFQPLERTAFQAVFLNLQRRFVGAEARPSLSMFDVAGLLAETFDRCFTTESIVHGFKESGLWPLDRDLIVPNRMLLECVNVKDEANGCAYEENLRTDEDDGSVLSCGNDESSSSDSENMFFYNKIEDFLRKYSSDESIYVLGEICLSTPSVVTNVKLFVNAVGTLLPPYLTYSTDADDILLESSLGITCDRCEKDVDDQHVLLKSVEHFRKHAFVTKDSKKLLLLEDANCSRLTRTFYEFGEANSIVLVSFPSKDSKCVHPLENSFVKKLKRRFEEVRHQLDSINDVIGFLEQAFIELFESEEIVDKFREYGIYPIETTNESALADEETEKEPYFKGDSKVYYDEFIIEEEIEVTVDEEVSSTE